MSDISDLPSVDDQRRMTAELNARLKAAKVCQWTATDASATAFDTGCDMRQGTVYNMSWTFCPWCGGQIYAAVK